MWHLETMEDQNVTSLEEKVDLGNLTLIHSESYQQDQVLDLSNSKIKEEPSINPFHNCYNKSPDSTSTLNMKKVKLEQNGMTNEETIIESPSYQTYTKQLWKNHVSGVHEGKKSAKSYMCNICHYPFKDSGDRRRHIQEVHEGKNCQIAKNEQILQFGDIILDRIFDRRHDMPASTNFRHRGLRAKACFFLLLKRE